MPAQVHAQEPEVQMLLYNELEQRERLCTIMSCARAMHSMMLRIQPWTHSGGRPVSVLTPMQRDAIAYIRSPAAIRERCQQVLELACADRLHHWVYHSDKLSEVADYVAAVTPDAYPNLEVPFPSRWRHFDVGGIDRVVQLDGQLGACSPIERARCHFDLAITSVLLDAGAGERWHYREAQSGQTYSRSEGLAVASF